MSNSTENKPKAEDIAHNVWLASLGTVGKGYNFVQSEINKSREKSQGLFEEFVVRGEKVESSTKDKLAEAQARIQSAKDSVKAKREELLAKSKDAIDERVNLEKVKSRVEVLRAKVSGNIDIPKFNTDEAISQIRETIDEVSKDINQKFSTLTKS